MAKLEDVKVGQTWRYHLGIGWRQTGTVIIKQLHNEEPYLVEGTAVPDSTPGSTIYALLDPWELTELISEAN